MDTTTPLNADVLLRHEAFVMRLARSLVRDEATAEDVAQETLLAALEHQPQRGALRSWLARVTRHRALDQLRSERRRGEREERSARAETVEPDPTAQERLELEHRVVSAVLQLEEPYRGVVIAAYYEGLGPTEIAQRRRVAPGTVRSQLSRALDQLRSKLDRETGGDRAAWSVALFGLLRSRDATVPGTTGAVSNVTAGLWPVVLVGSAAILAAAAIGWRVLLPDAPMSRVGPTASSPLSTETEAASDYVHPARGAPRLAPAGISANAEVEAPARDERAAQLQALLVRTRQVKTLILERRLEVDPADRQRLAWLEAYPDAGVTKLLEQNVFGSLGVPWMRGGGAYFSFTERVHDYNRRPQIELVYGAFVSGFYGGAEGLVMDLGPIGLRGAPSVWADRPPGLDRTQELEWEAVWRDGDFLRRLHDEVEGAVRDGGIGIEERRRWQKGRPPVVAGHTYLLRSRSSNEHDVVVVFEVVRASPEECTIAWRLLESRAVSELRAVRQPAYRREDLPATPPELAELSETELRGELSHLRADAEGLLFDTFPPEIEERFGPLRQRTDAGLTRLIWYLSQWTELASPRSGGAYYTLAARTHDARWTDVLFQKAQGPDAQGSIQVSGHYDALVDLGDMALESVELDRLPESLGELGVWMVGFELDTTGGTQQPPRDSGSNQVDPRHRAHEQALAFGVRATELGAQKQLDLVPGHTYLLRTIRPGDPELAYDLLAAVHIAGLDEQGVVIAWRILKRWPVDLPR